MKSMPPPIPKCFKENGPHDENFVSPGAPVTFPDGDNDNDAIYQLLMNRWPEVVKNCFLWWNFLRI